VFKVTADTNIYVAALNFGGKPQDLLELDRAHQIELAIFCPLMSAPMAYSFCPFATEGLAPRVQ